MWAKLLNYLVAAFLCAGTIGCTDNSSKRNTEEIVIVSSIPPLASVAKALAGDKVIIRSLIDRMSDPHSFDLKPSQAAEIEKSSLVLLVGGGYEPWSRNIDQSKIVSINDSLPSDYQQIKHNNHYWLDPEAIRFFARELNGKLISLNIAGSQERLAKFEKELTSLEEEIDQAVNTWHRRGYFSSHPTWSYFARRFILNELGSLRSEHGRELGAKSTARLYELAKDPLHKVLFREVHEPLDLVNSFLADTGSRLVTLDALGDGRESYPELLRRNVKAMSKAMQE